MKKIKPHLVLVATGLVLQILGSTAFQYCSECIGLVFACLLVSVTGTVVLIVGLSRCAKEKGWNAAVGYLGLLSWVGAIIVLLLPARKLPDAEQQKRRPFQFGILSMLIAVVVVAFITQYAVVIWKTWIKNDVALSNLGSLTVQVKRRGDPVYEIILSEKTTDDDLKQIKSFSLLHRFESDSVHITDVGLSNFAGLRYLEYLAMPKGRFSNRGIEYLTTIPKLQALVIGTTDIDDDGLQCLGSLHSLRQIEISSAPKITAQGIERLQELLPDCQMKILNSPTKPSSSPDTMPRGSNKRGT